MSVVAGLDETMQHATGGQCQLDTSLDHRPEQEASSNPVHILNVRGQRWRLLLVVTSFQGIKFSSRRANELLSILLLSRGRVRNRFTVICFMDG